MKLTILGSGSPESYARRGSSGYLIETGGQRILFDCGGGVVDRLIKAGLRPSDIDVVAFSHLHSDHMMDYARLVHAAWDETGKVLKVIGPEPIAEITERLFGPQGVFAYDLTARTELKGSQEVWLARGGTLPRPWPAPNVTEIAPGEGYAGNGWAVQSCEALHAQPYLVCMGFALQAEGVKFVYSGDAGITDALEALVADADLLLHWCYRLSDETDVSAFYRKVAPTPAEIAAMAERNGVKKLVLSHFRVAMDAPDRYAGAVEELKTHFSGPSAIAEDLDAFEITG